MNEVNDLCDTLKEKFTRMENENNSLREKIKKLESGMYEKEEMARIKSRYDEMKKDYYRGFPITEKEEEKINKWMQQHEKEHSGGHGAIGGKYTYVFTPTAIMTFGSVKCTCGAEYDFDFD